MRIDTTKWIHKILLLLIVKPLFRIFFRLHVKGLEHIKGLTGPLLIISNHKYYLDSFAVGAAAPITTNIHPVRIMGEVQHFFNPALDFLRKIGIIKLIYLIFGVFPAIRGSGLKVALEKPVKILRKQGVVFIHPEGKIARRIEVDKFKRGAAALAIKTRVKILPVALKLKGRNYYIKFGPVFEIPQTIRSYAEGANYMRNIILKLYKTIPNL